MNKLLTSLRRLLREDEMDAERVCLASFSAADICTAKKVLFQSLGIAGTFILHRRGDESGEKSLKDIVDVLRERESDLPEFVATEVSRLPSCIPEHVDLSGLLKEIVALKAGMAEILKKFDDSQTTIAELRKEIRLRNSAPETRSPAGSNFKCNDRASNVDSVSLHVADTVHAVPRPACPLRAGPPPAPSFKSRHRYADAVAGRSVATDRRDAPSRVCEVRVPPKEKPSRTDVDKEGFTTVSRKRKPRKSHCGTAEQVGSGLRVATPSKALYVSRLHYTATADDVVEYIRQKTGFSLRVFQLRSRHYVHFSSFVVRVPRPLQETVACADFWPKGVVFRRFRGNLPNPTPEMTMQRGHAVSSPK